MLESFNLRMVLNGELRMREKGTIGRSAGEKNARRAMRAAEIAYQKELGIYRPTWGEQLRARFHRKDRGETTNT